MNENFGYSLHTGVTYYLITLRNIFNEEYMPFCRHPLTRLVSAYRQRFANGKLPQLKIWNKRPLQTKKSFNNYWLPLIISHNIIPATERQALGIPHKDPMRKMYSATLLKKVHARLGKTFHITFPMFLRHVIYTHQIKQVDSHWRPIEWLCSPCLLHYDYIVKLETMTEDVKYVFEQLNIPSDPEKRKNVERSTKSPWADLEKYKYVPLDLKKEIVRLYWNDFYLFDYKLPPGFLDQ
ncbi:hypothetical protein SK128_013898 [Halocaridina rubra]|uniref:Carbohydrate sulfotransferase n=1 Tax=Halocaridina rubra TaxID=373956 RepID=A0AAN8X8K8_HALRR